MTKQIQRIVALSVLILMTVPALSSAAVDREVTLSSTGYGQSVSSIRSRVASLRANLQSIQRVVDLIAQERDTIRQRVQSGVAPQSDLASTEAKLAEGMSKLEQVMLQLEDAERQAALAKPIDVNLKSASVSQAAETLGKAANIRITVSDNVPKDLGVTMEAKRSPLGAVLEMMAEPAGLVIAPGERGSIVLSLPGQVEVNGGKIDLWGPNFPWSEEWPYAGTPDGALGQRWVGILRAAMPTASTTAVTYEQGTGSASQPVITSLSPNTFIFGEPGTNEKGEPGMWLTYYSIDSGKMIPGIKYFHVYATPKRAAEGSKK